MCYSFSSLYISKDEERAKVEEAAHETLQQKIDRLFFVEYNKYQNLHLTIALLTLFYLIKMLAFPLQVQLVFFSG